MECKELFQLARDYQTKANDIPKAITFYKEIVRLFPYTIEAEYAKIQINTFEGKTHGRYIILPIPLTQERCEYGGVEYIMIGEKQCKINIPSGVRIGQKIRLRGISHFIDSDFIGGDVYLHISSINHNIYGVKRDVMVELPVDFYLLSRLRTNDIRKIKIYDKKFDIQIPSNAVQGQELKLEGIAKYINGGFPGDIICRLVKENRNRWSIFGLFDKFNQYELSKFGIKFHIPFICEIYNEFVLKNQKFEFHTDNK